MDDLLSSEGGKPLTEKQAKRQAAILAAAQSVFSEHGFAEARLDEVARRARVAKGTIYLYVDSKEALFRAVVRRSIVPIVDDLSDRIDRYDGPAVAMLHAMLGRLREGLSDPVIRAIVRLIISEAPRFPDLAEFYHREVVSRGVAAIRKVVARGVESGEFRPNAVEAFPQLVVAPLLLGAVWQELFEAFDHLDVDGLIDAHLDTLINGIASAGSVRIGSKGAGP